MCGKIAMSAERQREKMKDVTSEEVGHKESEMRWKEPNYYN